jgi:hypothetical protein
MKQFRERYVLLAQFGRSQIRNVPKIGRTQRRQLNNRLAVIPGARNRGGVGSQWQSQQVQGHRLMYPTLLVEIFFCRIPTWSYIVVALLASVLTQDCLASVCDGMNGSVLSYPVGALESFIAGKMAEA